MAATRKFNVNEPRSGGGGTWRAQTVSPEMVTEQQLNHNWRTGGYNYQHDSDETTSTSSEDRLEQGCVPMGSITKEPPPWRKRRTTDDIISEPPMKKPHTSDYVAVKQEHANDVKQEDQGGASFVVHKHTITRKHHGSLRCTWARSYPFCFANPRNRHQSSCVSGW